MHEMWMYLLVSISVRYWTLALKRILYLWDVCAP